MSRPRNEAIVEKLLAAAEAAAAIVMEVYAEADFGAELKGPNDPVTRADKRANAFLLERLARDFPGVPIVAEESDPASFAGFQSSRTALFVDPVDGTREFIQKNGEFAVMIGYAEDGRATCGVIHAPAFDNAAFDGLAAPGRAYIGAEGVGAFRIAKDGGRTRITVSDVGELTEARAAVSRFNRNPAVEGRLSSLGLKELVTVGSAGLKAVKIATAELEMYAHPSGSKVKLWDACGPDAVVRAAGGVMTDARGMAFDYRGDLAQGNGTIAANPVLHREAVTRLVAFEAGRGGA